MTTRAGRHRARNGSIGLALLAGLAAILLGSRVGLTHADSLDQPPACEAGQLSLNLAYDAPGGATLLVKNTGGSACGLVRLPSLAFSDAKGTRLPILARLPGGKFMHPGPVMFPIALEPGRSLQSALHWTSGLVAPDGGVCLRPAAISLAATDGTVSAPLAASVCGPAPDAVQMEITRFTVPG